MIILDMDLPNRCMDCRLYVVCRFYNTGPDINSRPKDCPIVREAGKDDGGHMEKVNLLSRKDIETIGKAIVDSAVQYCREKGYIRIGEEYRLEDYNIETVLRESEDDGKVDVSFIITRKEKDAETED